MWNNNNSSSHQSSNSSSSTSTFWSSKLSWTQTNSTQQIHKTQQTTFPPPAVKATSTTSLIVVPKDKDLKHFQKQCCDTHNEYRRLHNAPPLKLNKTICAYAQARAQDLANRNVLQHLSNCPYGENLYYFSGDQVHGSDPVKSWYDEIKHYNFNDRGKFSQQTGHFTQVIWKNSNNLGVGYAKSQKGGVYVVANYDPPGNFQNQFNENVLPIKGNNMAATTQTITTPPRQQTTKPLQSSSTTSAPASFTSLLTSCVPTLMTPTPSLESHHTNDIDLIKFQTDCLNTHNHFRKNHGCPPLVLNRELCNYAQEWATQIAENCRMEHRPKNKYGENIFWSKGMDVTGDIAVKNWYKEIKDYNYADAKFDVTTGHFTQVIWKNSVRLGIGIAKSSDGAVYVVGNYDPPGNFIDEFDENVPRML